MSQENSIVEQEVSVSRYLVSRIEELGIDLVPVFQGGNIMKVIDEVGQSKTLKYVCPNHEQALSMMVETYARIRGFGVGMVTSGPGALNLVTGIADAYYDSVPCMFITGQVGMFHVKGNRRVRQRGYQESDIVSVTQPITKWSVRLEKAEDARYVFEKAVHLAKSGRPGPVLIDFPYNVQRAMVRPSELRGYDPAEDATAPSPAEVSAQAAELLALLRAAERPVFLIGGGARLSGQADNIVALAHALGVPTGATWPAADVFAHDDPLYLGTSGRHAHRSVAEAILNTDLLVGLGTRFTTKVYTNDKQFAPGGRIVMVDADRSEMDEGLFDPHTRICSDLALLIPEMLRQLGADARPSAAIEAWRRTAAEWKARWYPCDDTTSNDDEYVSPYRLIDALSEELGERAIITADTGCNLIWTFQAYKPKRGQRLISALGNSPMGFSFPAAIGAHYADPQATAVAVIGDGGMQLNIQELQTVAVNKVPVKVFVLNNRCLGNTKFPSRDFFEGRTHANEPGFGYEAPDFLAIAKAYGIPAVTIANGRNLRQEVRAVLQTPGPVLVDVSIDPEQSYKDVVL